MSRIALLTGAGMLAIALAPGVPALAQTAGSSQMGRSTMGSSGMNPSGMGSSTMDPSPSGSAGMNSSGMDSSSPGAAQMGAPQTGSSRIQPPPVAQPRGREAMGSMQPARPVGETQQQRRQLDNVANALNQCQMQPEEQRSQCMRRAMESRL